MNYLRSWGIYCLLIVPFAGTAVAEEIDWSAWKGLPVHHNGRIMPLDTFARQSVEIICGRQKPTLSIDGYLPEEALDDPQYAGVKSLFGGETSRKFDPAELLLSWLVEPEKWEQVPFLAAADLDLREDILEVPATSEAGEHLKFVSPSDVDNSDGFHDHIAELVQRRRTTMNSGEEFELTGIDEEVDRLRQSDALFRQLIFEPAIDMSGQQALIREFQTFAASWDDLRRAARLFDSSEERAEPAQGDDEFGRATGEAIAWLNEQGVDLDTSLISTIEAQLNEVVETGSVAQPLIKDVETKIGVVETTIQAALVQWSENRELVEKAVADSSDAQSLNLRLARGLVLTTHASLRELAAQAGKMQRAIYENGESLRVVPALNVSALEEDRDTSDASQPWLDLQTLLFGSDSVLADYPQEPLQAARNSFASVRDLYPAREQRPRDFSTALAAFSTSLRELGEAIEPVRRDLPIQNRDEDLLAYTAYPEVGATDIEVMYNRVDPFMKAWVIYLVAAVAVSLAFGVAKKPMFWVGVLILLFGIGWSVYGFALRIAITEWAPVTNMYETVIYVPFVVATLGAWFTLLPATWPGIRAAWRLTAIVGTWEQTELDDTQRAIMPSGAWKMGSIALLIPRAALAWLTFDVLAVQPYSAGGRTIINRLPNVDVGATLPDFNDAVTWLVGICVLVPTVWYLPRVLITAVLSIGMVPVAAVKSKVALLPKVYERRAIAGSAAFVAFLGTCVAWYSPLLDGNFSPLMPVLRDNFWLTIHVLTIVSSYGAGALAWGLGNVALAYYIFGKYREPAQPKRVPEGYQPARVATGTAAMRAPEPCSALAKYIYSAMQVAVLLLAAGTILGGLWADVSWGRFWGWDPKEVWALISLLTYLAILHARYAGWVGNFGLALGTVFGASAIGMSWYGVNFVLGAGLHAYGFGSGGQAYITSLLIGNWAFAGIASARYWTLCQPFTTSTSHDMTPTQQSLDVANVESGHA